jgi:hypothetical protein
VTRDERNKLLNSLPSLLRGAVINLEDAARAAEDMLEGGEISPEQYAGFFQLVKAAYAGGDLSHGRLA